MLIPILNKLNDRYKSFYIKDPLEPEKGMSKAILNTKNIFNCEITSFLHGGQNFGIDFDEESIAILLDSFKDKPLVLEKIIPTLIEMLISNNFSTFVIKRIPTHINDLELRELFKSLYDLKYLEKEALKVIKDFSMLIYSGRVSFIDKTKSTLELYSKQDLKLIFDNKKKRGVFSPKIHNMVDVYIASSLREDYTNIVFKEVDKALPHEFNQFKGLPYSPKKIKDTSFFWTYVFEVLCDRDLFLYEVVRTWLAFSIQNLFEKAGTCLVIGGPKGCGKSTFVKIISKLFGKYFMHASSSKRLIGDFNVHLSNNLLLYANEFFALDPSLDGKLKSLITDLDMTYEVKGGFTFSGENYSSIIIDSNSSQIVRVDKHERRYIMLEATGIKIGDTVFFNQLHALANDNDFLQSLMYDLSNYDVTPNLQHIRKAPFTKNVIAQLLENLNPLEQWWHNCLENGTLFEVNFTIEHDTSIRVGNDELFISFKNFTKKYNIKDYGTTSAFTKKIKKAFLPAELILKDNIKNSRGDNAKIIADLKKCRNYFTSTYGITIESIIEEWRLKLPLPL